MSLEEIDSVQLNYIVAGPRTGSTLLKSMLHKHSEITGSGEEAFSYHLYTKYHSIDNWTSAVIEAYIRDFYLFSSGKLIGRFTTYEAFKSLLEKHKGSLNFSRVLKLTYLSFHQIFEEKKTIKSIIDKQLEIRCFWKEITKFYPQSKFVFLCRNPLDNVPRMKVLYGRKRDRSIIEMSIRFNYRYKLLLKQKKKIDTSKVFVVYYEELIRNPEKTLKSICTFLDFEFEERMLKYHETFSELADKIEANPSEKLQDLEVRLKSTAIGITQKPNENKIGAWKNEISNKEANIIWKICGRTAEEMGYEKDPSIQSVKLPPAYYYYWVKQFLFQKIIVRTWYKSPFLVRKLAKKIFYGRRVDNYIKLIDYSRNHYLNLMNEK